MAHTGSTGRPVLSLLQLALLLACVVGYPLGCWYLGAGEDAASAAGFACAVVAAAVLLRAFLLLQPPRPFASIVPRVLGLAALTALVASAMSFLVMAASHPTFAYVLERDFGAGSGCQIVSIGRSGSDWDGVERKGLPDPAAADRVVGLVGSGRLDYIREEPAFASYSDFVYLLAFEDPAGHRVEYSIDSGGYLRDGSTGSVYMVGCNVHQVLVALERLYAFC